MHDCDHEHGGPGPGPGGRDGGIFTPGGFYNLNHHDDSRFFAPLGGSNSKMPGGCCGCLAILILGAIFLTLIIYGIIALVTLLS